MFIDEAVIEVKGGDGGDGVVAFRREKYVPMGGPSGGDGGNGGSVVLHADPHRKTLLELSRHRHHKGGRGLHGQGSRCKGSDGGDAVIPVPLGTQIFDDETGQLLADLVQPGQTFIAAHGGSGGRGNVHFSSSVRHAPRFSEKGIPGEERRLRLSLKLLADVALIGLPNAGKSTLISAISAAKPKIANYPFTTLIPNLGVVRLDETRQFIVADIPGLIRGASAGAGLGHQFLKHVERAPIFIHLLDAGQYLEGSQSLWRHFLSINRELKLWNEDLAHRPQLVAFTKLDTLPGNEEAQREVEKTKAKLLANDCEVFEISAATGEGVPALLERVWSLVEIARAQQLEREQLPPVEVTRVQVDKPFSIRESARFADGLSEWEAEGGMLERLVNRFDLENHEAVLHVHRLLERHGVIEQLKQAGVKPGDLVHVGNLAFEFEE